MFVYIIFLIFTAFLSFSYDNIEAKDSIQCSVNFSREIDIDNNLPFDYYTESNVDKRSDLDISHVSFSSDGELLNAKIWLNGNLREEYSSWLTYGIAIDSDFNLDNGDVGADYGYYYEYIGDESLLRDNEDPNVKVGHWYSVMTEFASINQYIEQRNPIEITDFQEQSNVIDFSVDLKNIGNCPENYVILFYATDYKDQEYEITDITRWIEIPPPEFILSTKPSSIQLNAGKQDSVKIFLQTTSALEHQVDFSILDQPSQKLENLEIELLEQDAQQVLFPNSLTTAHINIKAPDMINSTNITYQVGVSAEIQPSADLIMEYVENNPVSSIGLSSYETSPMTFTTFFPIILSNAEVASPIISSEQIIFIIFAGIVLALVPISLILFRKFKPRLRKTKLLEPKVSPSHTNILPGNKKALVVGVSHYDDKNLNDLDFCEKDGQAMFELLTSLGYDIKIENKLIGKVPGLLLREKIIDFFQDSNIRARDTLLLYFSGHGVPDMDDIFFASSDIDTNKPMRNGFSSSDLWSAMNKSKSRKIVVILDCCYSGSAHLGKGSTNVASVGHQKISKNAEKIEGEGKCLLLSSQNYQESFELENHGLSVFTYYLLDGLNGNKESVDVKGNVTVHTLSNYVFDKVTEVSEQRPLIKSEISGDIPLAQYKELATD